MLIPLYLSHQGYSLGVVGLVAGLAGVATLLSRVPVPKVYRPERAATLLVILSIITAISSLALPFAPGLIWFALVLFLNRAVAGASNAIFLARFLDMMGQHTDRRKSMGYYGGTQAIGFTASNLVSGLMADFLGYPAAFAYGAVTAAVVGILLVGARTPLGSRRAGFSGVTSDRPKGVRGWLHGVADPGLWSVLNVSTWNNFFHAIQTSFFPVLGLVIGLTPGEIGVVRAVYSAVNAVGRPIAGIVMTRFSLRQISYLGIGVQAALLIPLPFITELGVFMLLSFLAGLGRAVVVVASSAGLAEEVDETRVTRGMSTAAYSTTADLPLSVGPLVAGFTAAAIGVGSMFPVTGVGFLICFVAGDLAVSRWRVRRANSVCPPG